MSFEDRKFTRQQVIHSLRLCADSGDCKSCDFFEAECPRGYNPCHEFKMMELAADYIEGQKVKVINIEDPYGLGMRGDCPECGAYVNEDYAYCPNCGIKLEWG